jgi:hypothetical protein
MTPTLHIRKFVSYVEELVHEADRPVDPPVLRVAAGAVIRNPWAGQGYVEDLWPGINAVTPPLTRALTERMVALAGGPDRVHGFGKAAVVGENGEIEHASALLHGPYLGPYMRHTVNGTSLVTFAEVRGAPGTPVAIPTIHKTDTYTRDYYHAFEVRVPDAPHADEIVVLLGAVTGPRPHARSGDRSTDPAVDFDSF